MLLLSVSGQIHFSPSVNLTARTGQGRKAVYGTDDGIYLSNLMERNREPVKVLALKDVAQLDVLEDYQLLIVLSGNPSISTNHREYV